jgi:hypothetical protein
MENWRFKAKAVTKYNPDYYNAEGNYSLEEWTSYSDIGKRNDTVNQCILTKERYLEVENSYVEAVKLFISEIGATKILLVELYKTSGLEDFQRHHDEVLYTQYVQLEAKEYAVSNIDGIIRLALREYIQVTIELITSKMDCAIHFGYDYYMYFESSSIDFDKLKKELCKYQMYLN